MKTKKRGNIKCGDCGCNFHGMEGKEDTCPDCLKETMATSKTMLSVTECAERFKVTRQAILKRIKTGKLKTTKVGKTYVIIFD